VSTDRERPPRYPRVMRLWQNSPAPVTSGDFLSQHDAAKVLGVSVLRVGWLIACAHLDPADGPSGEAGVTVASVEREALWRTNATLGERLRRGIGSALRWL
jgi:hypothetical protein